jgi:hypothetical protein
LSCNKQSKRFLSFDLFTYSLPRGKIPEIPKLFGAEKPLKYRVKGGTEFQCWRKNFGSHFSPQNNLKMVKTVDLDDFAFASNNFERRQKLKNGRSFVDFLCIIFFGWYL